MGLIGLVVRGKIPNYEYKITNIADAIKALNQTNPKSVGTTLVLVTPKSTNMPSKSTKTILKEPKTMVTQPELFQKKSRISGYSLSDGLARIIQLLENEKGRQSIHEAAYYLKRLGCSGLKNPTISLLKTCRDYSALLGVVTSTKQLKCSPTLGMTVNGKFLIQGGFSPKIESGYSLLDILEEHVDQKYFLSEKMTSLLKKKMVDDKGVRGLPKLVLKKTE